MIFKKAHPPMRTSGTIGVLDIGNSKIRCIIAHPKGKESFKIIGIGEQAAKGMRDSQIIDMQAVESAILNAVHLAEQSAGETLRTTYANISTCLSRSLTLEVSLAGQPVDELHQRRLLSLANQIDPPSGYQPLHTLPLTYTLDGRRGIRDPLGMYGEVLALDVHTIYVPLNALRNLMTCIEKCHLSVEAFIATPLANGFSALLADEKELGVTLIDIGGGLTSIGCFTQGQLIFTDYIPIGSRHITTDIARMLGSSLSEAERLKNLYGSALLTHADEHELLQIMQIGEGQKKARIVRADLIRVIRSRLEEIFEIIGEQLKECEAFKKTQRIVLVGGGSQISNIEEMATQFFQRSVRLGRITDEHLQKVLGPSDLLTGLGLLQGSMAIKPAHSAWPAQKGIMARMTQWFYDNF